MKFRYHQGYRLCDCGARLRLSNYRGAYVCEGCGNRYGEDEPTDIEELQDLLQQVYDMLVLPQHKSIWYLLEEKRHIWDWKSRNETS